MDRLCLDAAPVQDELGAAKAQVEMAIERLGISADACSLHIASVKAAFDEAHPGAAAYRKAAGAHDRTSWTLKRGSAAILITIVARGGAHVLRVVSPVMMPRPETKAQLYAHLLELNAAGLGNCAFGLVGDHVVLVSERPAHGATADEIEQIVRHLGAVADTYDDKLMQDFGGRRSADRA